ncbi:MAG: ParA family protein [Verrucomicrobia bacterium]|jgi:chromosome partitioning protein|nr:ParA family protein [Verrucomicrobiota bacterium]
MKLFAIANQKGGVGKTTTAVNLSACLAEKGKRVLLIDLDPQANATSAIGFETGSGNSIYPALIGYAKVEDKIAVTRYKGLSLVPGDLDLAGAEVEVARLEDHLTRLRTATRSMLAQKAFDYAFLDCPPSLGILMTNALAAADQLIIPLQCEYFALEGLSKIVHVIDQIRAVNPTLTIAGIVMTMFDGRTNLSQQVVDEVRNHFKKLVYQTIIPRSVRLGEAPSFGKPIIEYDSNGIGATAYRALTVEFLNRELGHERFADTSGIAAI